MIRTPALDHSQMHDIALLSYGERVFLLASLALLYGGAVLFYRRQQQPQRLGGRISLAKLAWLAYTVFVWFVLCPFLATAGRVGQPWRVILGSFAVCMWGRGIIELYMLYIRKNWRPSWGIAHDLLSLFLVVGLCLRYRTEIRTLQHPGEQWVLGLTGCVLLSLALEAFYASVFQYVAAGRTMGEQALWFVSKDEARLAWINRITAVCNVPLYGFLLAFLSVCLGLW